MPHNSALSSTMVLSEATTEYDFSEEVLDATLNAELTVLGTNRVAVVFANVEMRFIETHFAQTSKRARSQAQWLTEQFPEGAVYVVGADILDS